MLGQEQTPKAQESKGKKPQYMGLRQKTSTPNGVFSPVWG
jgi:hypothetical protein